MHRRRGSFCAGLCRLPFGVALHFTPKAYPEGSPRSGSLSCYLQSLPALDAFIISNSIKPPFCIVCVPRNADRFTAVHGIISVPRKHFLHQSAIYAWQFVQNALR